MGLSRFSLAHTSDDGSRVTPQCRAIRRRGIPKRYKTPTLFMMKRSILAERISGWGFHFSWKYGLTPWSFFSCKICLTRMPIVDRNNPQEVIGMISPADLLQARTRDLEEERRRERVLRFGLPFALLRLRNLERRHAHLNPVPHHACFMKRNLRLDSAETRVDRWQEMSLRSFCRASFPALLADLPDPLSDLLDLCVGL